MRTALTYALTASFPLILAGSAMANSSISTPDFSTAPFSSALSRTLAALDIHALEKSPELAAPMAPYLVAATPATGYGWGMILEKYLKAPDDIGVARFNYRALHANETDRQALDDYIEKLEAANVPTFSDDEAVVYWANLYNAVTIKVIVDNYPVDSIKDIRSGWRSGPWKRDLVTINGKKMSLDDIEHKTMRKKYPSPLIHYMVNCASIGCPNLKAGPWTAATLDADREAAARIFINSPRGARITDKGLKVSSIYKWYKEDFGGNEAGILEHLREYADDDLAAAIDGGAKIIDYGYIWSLNE